LERRTRTHGEEVITLLEQTAEKLEADETMTEVNVMTDERAAFTAKAANCCAKTAGRNTQVLMMLETDAYQCNN
jgi:predicted Zn-ribbon and HTH transcriptional regulator